MGLKFRVQINAKPEDVFGYLSDVSRHGEWGTGGLKTERVSDGPVGLGSKFRSSQKFTGKDATADITIREFDPPRSFQIAAVQTTGGSKPATFVHSFTLSPTNGGTMVVRDVTRENASPLAAFGIVFYPAIKADAMKGLNALKAKVEGGAR